MAANANSDLSTITSPAGAVPDDLPVVEVEGVNATVKVKWGTLGSQQTTASLDASYTDTCHATDSTGVEPLVKTYGTLLGCNGGTLTIQATRYRIQVIQKLQQANGKKCFRFGWFVRSFIVEFIQVILLTINLPLFDNCGYIIDWFALIYWWRSLQTKVSIHRHVSGG
jgi:hypothetical protein